MRSGGTAGRGAAMAAAAMLAAGCPSEPEGRQETGLEQLSLTAVNPRSIVPGSQLQLDGVAFLDQPLGLSWLRLQGTYAGAPLDAYLPASFVDFERMRIDVSANVLRLLGPPSGSFEGRAQVEIEFIPDGSRHFSAPLSVALEIHEHLEPVLERVDASDVIFVNEPIQVTGAGMLLGGDEGTTFAVVEGCFTAESGDGQCEPVGPVEVPVKPAEAFDRERGVFAFSPRIAGIGTGTFDGRVSLRNEHADGTSSSSGEQTMRYRIQPTKVDWIGDELGDAVGTLGKYIDVRGGGFVGPDDGGGTVLHFTGTYAVDGVSQEVPVDLEVVPQFVDGRTVRYVINEEDALARAVDVRQTQGTFIGQVRAIVDFEGDSLEGAPTDVSFRLEPVKQVVYLRFNPTYVESLRMFGLRALDPQIRDRVKAVLERDYEGVNVEVRTEPPEDYALYATIEIAGPDPNGAGLLGYDNTPGKDVNNQRLNDYIGGVNAVTIEDGFLGFGGVFMESLFTFSKHPPAGTVASSEVSTPMFDEVFDPFRPDRGQPVTLSDFAGGPIAPLDSGARCPAQDRPTRIACAVFVLGSVVGSTVSHELGHSLGLAEPLGTAFHNTGDLPNRLMDSGSGRSFEERAELMGQGPSRFCVDAYRYLREILPTKAPESTVERPRC